MPARALFVASGRLFSVAARPSVVVAPKSAYADEKVLRRIVERLNNTVSADMIRSLAAELEPPKGAGASTISTITASGSRLDLVAVTETCSRMNAPGRPDCYAAAVDSWPSKDANAIVFIQEPGYVFKIANAIASKLPLFTMKPDSKVWDYEIAFESVSGSISEKQLSVAGSLFAATRHAGELVDTHPAVLHPQEYARRAQAIASELGVSCTVISGKELETRGFGGIWNVGKGAEFPPALVVLSYQPTSNPKKRIAIVGKGITYDTGGLGIKTPKEFMCGMKCDMGGSAAALNAFKVLVSEKLVTDCHVYAVLCLAENAINERVFRNDDIITLYSGKTVEVNNTDAEGRLVLSDGVSYAEKDLHADTIVTIATLTGSQGIATGVHFAAVMSDSEELEARAVRAGRVSGNLVHPIPYCPEFFISEFSSKVASKKNSVKNRSNAQSSCAGEFIHDELSKDFKGEFLHVDIASPAFQADRGTGFGVSLLTLLFSTNAEAAVP
eukprot:ANDGO_02495.mRNA.1 hypothetical protein